MKAKTVLFVYVRCWLCGKNRQSTIPNFKIKIGVFFLLFFVCAHKKKKKNPPKKKKKKKKN